jgi:hypothetical protein
MSPNPFLWSDFLNSLPTAPPQTFAQQIGALLGDWWSWVWRQAGVNGPPLASNDTDRILPASNVPSLAAAATMPLNVLNNDIDPEHDAMVAVLQTTTQHGSLTLNPDGTFDYTPNLGFQGVDTFTYTAYDFITESRPATVRMSVVLRGAAVRNSLVEGGEFVAWPRKVGAAATPAGSGADGDGDGMVNAADELAWQDNFGVSAGAPIRTAGSISSAAALQVGSPDQLTSVASSPLAASIAAPIKSVTSQPVSRQHALSWRTFENSRLANDHAFAAAAQGFVRNEEGVALGLERSGHSNSVHAIDLAFARLATHFRRGTDA